MTLREDVARALCVAFYKDMSSPEFVPPDEYTEDWHGEADAALAVVQADYARRIDLALGRINEVRVRLGGAPDGARHWPVERVTELHCSLLDAMTQLQSLLPAERAAEWSKKQERQP